MREYLKKRGEMKLAFSKDPTLFDELCEHMTTLGYDVPKLIKQYKQRIN